MIQRDGGDVGLISGRITTFGEEFGQSSDLGEEKLLDFLQKFIEKFRMLFEFTTEILRLFPARTKFTELLDAEAEKRSGDVLGNFRRCGRRCDLMRQMI